MLGHKIPRSVGDREVSRRDDGDPESGGEDDEEEVVPAAEERLRRRIGIGSKKLTKELVVGLVQQGGSDDSESSEGRGNSEFEVEEDDREEEGEDDRDGESEALGDVVGVLDGEGCEAKVRSSSKIKGRLPLTNEETSDRLQSDHEPDHGVEAVEEALRRRHYRIVPVLEGVDHALEVEGKSSVAHDVTGVGLDEDDDDAEEGREERELNVAHPEAGGFDVGRSDEKELLHLGHDGLLLDDELKVRGGDGAREARDEDGRDARQVAGGLGGGNRSMVVRVGGFGVDGSELHGCDAGAEHEKREPLGDRKATAEHRDGAHGGNQGLSRRTQVRSLRLTARGRPLGAHLELEGDLKDGNREVASSNVAARRESLVSSCPEARMNSRQLT